MTEETVAQLNKNLEIIRLYVDFIPDELEKKYAELLKQINEANEKGETQRLEALIHEVSPLTREMQTILDKVAQETKSKDFTEGEELLWFHRVTKGVLKKQLIQLWAITNKRAFLRDYEKATLVAIPLNSCEVVVMNQHRRSTGTRVGTFGGAYRGYFGGVSSGMSWGESKSYGDLCFMQGGRMILRFEQISDPQGIKQLVKAIQKQTAV